MNRTIVLAVAGVAATAGYTSNASARGPQRMFAVDYTKGNKPVFTDNGVNDGRVCKIYFKQVYDPWTEMFRKVKTKKCI